jgi:hypothetical protein
MRWPAFTRRGCPGAVSRPSPMLKAARRVSSRSRAGSHKASRGSRPSCGRAPALHLQPVPADAPLHQEPSDFHYPGLPEIEFHDRELLALPCWAATSEIRAEFDSLIAEQPRWCPTSIP